MSISLDSMAGMLNTTNASTAVNYNSQKLQGSLEQISTETTGDELLQVCKDFTSYFVEEILKEIKENLTEDDEKDGALSTMTDYHMDSTIEILADELVDEVGGTFVQQLYEQMKRNYGIE